MTGDNREELQVCSFINVGIPNFRGNVICGSFIFKKRDVQYRALAVPSHSLYDGEVRIGRLTNGNRYTELNFVNSFDYYCNIPDEHKDLYLSVCNSMLDIKTQNEIFELIKRVEYSCVGNDIKVYGDNEPFCTINGELSYVSVAKDSTVEYEALNSYQSKSIAFLRNIQILSLGDLTSDEITRLEKLLARVGSSSRTQVVNMRKARTDSKKGEKKCSIK
jgi:hypothetical protein